MNEALFRRNAAACESAKHPRCRCPCGGALHGKRHSERWIRSRLKALENAAALDALQASAHASADREREALENAAALDALQAFHGALKKLRDSR